MIVFSWLICLFFKVISVIFLELIVFFREVKRDLCSLESLVLLMDERDELLMRWLIVEMDVVRMVGEVYFRNCLLMLF